VYRIFSGLCRKRKLPFNARDFPECIVSIKFLSTLGEDEMMYFMHIEIILFINAQAHFTIRP
jgi:hypothetical protein